MVTLTLNNQQQQKSELTNWQLKFVYSNGGIDFFTEHQTNYILICFMALENVTRVCKMSMLLRCQQIFNNDAFKYVAHRIEY